MPVELCKMPGLKGTVLKRQVRRSIHLVKSFDSRGVAAGGKRRIMQGLVNAGDYDRPGLAEGLIL